MSPREPLAAVKVRYRRSGIGATSARCGRRPRTAAPDGRAALARGLAEVATGFWPAGSAGGAG